MIFLFPAKTKQLLDTLHDKFPFNTREMFKFHWTYDKGKVDLERLMGIMNRYNTVFSTFL